ncbi:MAG: PilZ domain-containing protein [Pseudodesulfovibrio sp.]|uniref:Type IV pilus assembly PilZ n=1 Tax=Pseudodesulfovibrio aespoeensis (strain ATCC 700646 / DSM 10631 / Aspo-2) TaxID=643562 RepID=E6VR52_PSEA9|nr:MULTISPECIES: PilZ domain-containing protein [Pseudodesulfovibrio]MBU4193004.1 PilZ domain-containing protein [Pseudomonadota bacterium]ADU64136.1 type IV pilus assembly PilZ [Pseudodesulfovibrio aespoeensis Aspo-2]MBU4243538.1 PilZ domain-containing protein [Pseudomonadota bacterium]MBU4379050.1 PilZ domain-containing protein [Pseudomonadota bacterium]MBU4475456.1 PilZ domain-containing protein [Pseudomonadota bacterium]
MSRDKRRNTRVDAGFEAYVTVGEVVMPVRTRNISLKGALLAGCGDCDEGTQCELHLPLSAGVRIVVNGVIRRCKGDEAAMAFTEMDDLSFTFLHRLVQLNAPDPESIDDELLDVFENF